ncbi:MAG: hypothetical protein JJT75_08235 [Opitutales bacterium]|nr:hypothetical protein [Opitutales bacterium]MCH8539757.1 hypothetical protein [Opitutales bacterium]
MSKEFETPPDEKPVSELFSRFISNDWRDEEERSAFMEELKQRPEWLRELAQLLELGSDLRSEALAQKLRTWQERFDDDPDALEKEIHRLEKEVPGLFASPDEGNSNEGQPSPAGTESRTIEPSHHRRWQPVVLSFFSASLGIAATLIILVLSPWYAAKEEPSEQSAESQRITDRAALEQEFRNELERQRLERERERLAWEVEMHEWEQSRWTSSRGMSFSRPRTASPPDFRSPGIAQTRPEQPEPPMPKPPSSEPPPPPEAEAVSPPYVSEERGSAQGRRSAAFEEAAEIAGYTPPPDRPFVLPEEEVPEAFRSDPDLLTWYRRFEPTRRFVDDLEKRVTIFKRIAQPDETELVDSVLPGVIQTFRREAEALMEHALSLEDPATAMHETDAAEWRLSVQTENFDRQIDAIFALYGIGWSIREAFAVIYGSLPEDPTEAQKLVEDSLCEKDY